VSDQWFINVDVAHAADEVVGMTREQLVARVNYLAPALTHDALQGLAIFAMTAPQRPLDVRAPAEEQRAREGGWTTRDDLLELEQQRADAEAQGQPLAVSRAMANALGPLPADGAQQATIWCRACLCEWEIGGESTFPHTCEVGSASGLMLNLDPTAAP